MHSPAVFLEAPYPPPYKRLIIILDTYRTLMVTSCLIVSPHPRQSHKSRSIRVVFLRFLPFKTPFFAPPSLSFQSLPDTFLLFGGGYTFLTERSANQRDLCSVFSSTYTLFQVTYPLTPLFATLTKSAGVYTNSSHSGTLRFLGVRSVCIPGFLVSLARYLRTSLLPRLSPGAPFRA